jgi:inhibitor of cysteine peptidase
VVEIAETGDGQEHRVRLGDEVLISLPENPTTGYRWRLSAPDALPLEEDGFEPEAPGRSGASGQRRLRLRAASIGTHRIALSRRRSWQAASADPPDLTFTVRVEP